MENNFSHEFKYVFSLMKFIGIMVHRDNKVAVSDENCTNSVSTEKEICEINTKKKINKIHLIYCLCLTILKLTAGPILFFLIVYSTDFQVLLGKKYFGTFKNESISSNRTIHLEFDFKGVLVLIAEIGYFLQLAFIPNYFIFLSIASDNFSSTCFHFLKAEKAIEDNFNELNELIANQAPNNKRPLVYEKKYKSLTFYIYLLVNLAFMSILIGFLAILYLKLVQIFDQYIKIVAITFCIIFSIFGFDLVVSLYFIYKIILLSVYQFNAFGIYLNRVIDESNSNQLELDIEKIRLFHKKICAYAFQIDSWFRYAVAFLYLTALTSMCCFIYLIFLGKLDEFDLKKSSLMFMCFANELLTITSTSIALNIMVSSASITQSFFLTKLVFL
jgi:hypothetical protein